MCWLVSIILKKNLSQVLEQAGLLAKRARAAKGQEGGEVVMITPRHLVVAVGRDEELLALCQGAVMTCGGRLARSFEQQRQLGVEKEERLEAHDEQEEEKRPRDPMFGKWILAQRNLQQSTEESFSEQVDSVCWSDPVKKKKPKKTKHIQKKTIYEGIPGCSRDSKGVIHSNSSNRNIKHHSRTEMKVASSSGTRTCKKTLSWAEAREVEQAERRHREKMLEEALKANRCYKPFVGTEPLGKNIATSHKSSKSVSATLSQSSKLEACLPTKWRVAQDSNSRIYFYDMKSREVRWEVPRDRRGGGELQGLGEGIKYSLNTADTDTEGDSDCERGTG